MMTPSVSALDPQRISVPSQPVAADARLPAPRTGEEAEQLLAHAEERRKLGHAIEEDLGRFVGSTNAIWTLPRKDRLITLLAGSPDGLRVALESVIRTPNAATIDDAVRVLLTDANPDKVDLYAAILEKAAPVAFPGLAHLRRHPDVRMVLVRALADHEDVLSTSELRALAVALRDASPDVRDAAAQAIAQRNAKALIPALEARRQDEPNSVVRESIEGTLAALRAS